MKQIWNILISVRTAVVLVACIVALLALSLFVGFSALVAFPVSGVLLALLFVLLFVSLLCCTLKAVFRGRTSAAGFLCHLGVLAVLIGCGVTALGREEGSLWLREGESATSFRPCTSAWWGLSWLRDMVASADSVQAETGSVEKGLGFELQLVDFSVDLYPPAIKWSMKKSENRGEFVPRKGERHELAGGYVVTVQDYFADYDIVEQLQGGKPVRMEISRSEESRNPLVRLNVTSPSGQSEVASLAARAAMHFQTADERLVLVYAMYGEMQTVKAFKSKVKVLEKGLCVKEATIEVNHPLVHGGYSIYQSSYDPGNLNSTELTVVRDPGARVAFAGFCLLALGLTWLAFAGRRGGGSGKVEQGLAELSGD